MFVDFLRKVPLFADLEDKDLDHLSTMVEFVKVIEEKAGVEIQ